MKKFICSVVQGKKNLLGNVAVVSSALLLIALVVYATTTIGTNITTEGNLTVTGNATTSGHFVVGTSAWNAPSTTFTVVGDAYITGSATTSDYLVVGATAWNAPTSTLTVLGNVNFHRKATTSDSIWLGTAGTSNYVDLVGGDLYVQDDLEVDGSAWLTAATTTGNLVVGTSAWDAPTATLTVVGNAYITGSATTSNNLVVGATVWDTPTSTLSVLGNVFFHNRATTSDLLWIGTSGISNRLNAAGGDLYVQDQVEIDGGAWIKSVTTTDSLLVGGNASTTGDVIIAGGTLDMTTSSATSTLGIFVRTTGSTSTSTISVGDAKKDTAGCIELVSNGEYYRIYIDGNGPTVIAELGRCN